MTTIYMIRHGQTSANADRIIQGSLDVPLNNIGEEQSNRLAKRLKNYGIEHLISSDLLRAKKTADIIAKEINVPIIEDKRLREINIGKWEGKSWDEVMKEDIRKKYIKNWFYYKEHEGESWENVYNRVSPVFENILKEYEGKKVAVVTHGGVIRIIIIYALCLQKNIYQLCFLIHL